MLTIVGFFLACVAILYFVKIVSNCLIGKGFEKSDGIAFVATVCLFAGCLFVMENKPKTDDAVANKVDSEPAETNTEKPKASAEPILYEYTENSYTTTDDPGVNSNAKRKARVCAEDLHMSKEGVYKYMTESNGAKYTDEAARDAVDNLDTDFQENAKIMAEYYSEEKGYGKIEIRKQLEEDLFSEEEIKFALDHYSDQTTAE